MKFMVALAAGWIAFVAVNMIAYGGIHTDVVAGALGALIGNVVS
jgi:hypothetical protein